MQKLKLFLTRSLIEAHKTRWDWKTILNVPLNVPLNKTHKTTWRGLLCHCNGWELDLGHVTLEFIWSWSSWTRNFPLVACFGLCLSTLSPNVPILMLTYGVIGGFGLGLIYLPAVICVGYYFESKRALATGISGKVMDNSHCWKLLMI